jgi:hypothetical protein
MIHRAGPRLEATGPFNPEDSQVLDTRFDRLRQYLNFFRLEVAENQTFMWRPSKCI